ncbi:MAG TPA: phosphoribosylformylglycinamidine synthase I [Candidatus Eremiobacteraceae bacterium]|nr:phosphoribosylformylglycinamidine synthase I [Candidatus Eremiobacteraceae bacterium]
MHDPLVAVVVFPGTNSEEETVDACRDAGMDARLFMWSDDAAALRAYDAYVLPGGFAHEDRVRAGAIAAKSAAVATIVEEAGKGKLVLGICNGAQVIAETGLLGDIAIARNLPARRFESRTVDVVVSESADRCAFTRGLAPGSILVMAAAHGEGRFFGSSETFAALEASGCIVLRYAGDAHNGSMHRAAGICNAGGNVLALMPHPERLAWRFNVAYRDPDARGGDPNEPAGAHAIFRTMATSLREQSAEATR